MPTTTVEFPQSLCRAGVARVDITPPVGIYHRMWGAATHDRSTGVHRPLTATVLTLAPGEDDSRDQLLLTIAVDHCLLWGAEMSALLDALSAGLEFDREQIVVFFSHTHAAGLMGHERQEFPGGDLIPQYLRDLAQSLLDAAKQAEASLAPATISYGTGHCGLATNRDYFDEQRGGFVCGFNPDRPVDDTVLVARVSDLASGETRAVIVNYACHPTTLAWDNTLISPDYVGATREVVEAAAGAPCFFIQGASGDVGPRDGYVGDVEVADRNGRQLGYAALEALERLPRPGQRLDYAGAVVSGATIGTWEYRDLDDRRREELRLWQTHRSTVPLPYREDLPNRDALQAEDAKWRTIEEEATAKQDVDAARDARAMVERARRRLTRVAHIPEGDAYPYPLRLWKIGDAIWVALDGEHYNVLQRQLRERFPNRALVVGTLANGSNVWYLPDAESYGKGLYQEDASILRQGALETLIDSLGERIAELTT
jgi:hypothetical protein